jgi:hypothetical protein
MHLPFPQNVDSASPSRDKISKYFPILNFVGGLRIFISHKSGLSHIWYCINCYFKNILMLSVL